MLQESLLEFIQEFQEDFNDEQSLNDLLEFSFEADDASASGGNIRAGEC